MTQRARLLNIKPLLQTTSVEEVTAWSDHSAVHVLVADSTDVVVLFQLCAASCGEAFDLVYSISPEQKALPAQLGSEPDVII